MTASPWANRCRKGGAHYNFTGPQGVGVANVGDSLMAIKKMVFDDRKLTLKQLKEALDSNFGGSSQVACTSCNQEDATYQIVMAAVKKILV